MSKYPTKFQLGQAADLLGLDVFDLMVMARNEAVTELERQTRIVRVADERPNMGRFQRFLAVAEVALDAWDDESGISEENAGEEIPA